MLRKLAAGALALAFLSVMVTTADARRRHHHHHHRHHHYRLIKAPPSGPAWHSDLVSAARRYMGTNPTGWAHRWCGRFMAMIAPQAARRVGNPNLAMNWRRLPKISPQVGAIAVLRRRGGGHVGVVSGFDGRGNPIIVSGNHNRRVGEGVYPRGRVVAWVSAT
jgi:uncharacterized protein (TIGR02594 family)